ncbi:unnamed protein product, partial [Pleuronectes platessa]
RSTDSRFVRSPAPSQPSAHALRVDGFKTPAPVFVEHSEQTTLMRERAPSTPPPPPHQPKARQPPAASGATQEKAGGIETKLIQETPAPPAHHPLPATLEARQARNCPSPRLPPDAFTPTDGQAPPNSQHRLLQNPQEISKGFYWPLRNRAAIKPALSPSKSQLRIASSFSAILSGRLLTSHAEGEFNSSTGKTPPQPALPLATQMDYHAQSSESIFHHTQRDITNCKTLKYLAPDTPREDVSQQLMHRE